MLDAARHDYVSAEMHFDRALTVHRSLRAPFHVARTHLEWARVLLRQALPGGTGAARLHLESARRIADEAGCALVYSTAEGIFREVASTGRDA